MAMLKVVEIGNKVLSSVAKRVDYQPVTDIGPLVASDIKYEQ